MRPAAVFRVIITISLFVSEKIDNDEQLTMMIISQC